MKNVYLLFILSIYFSPQYLISQNKKTPISIEFGFAGHGLNKKSEPGASSLAFQTIFHLYDRLNIDIRYDHHILAHGSTLYNHSSGNTYGERESFAKNMSSLSFIPNYEFTFAGVNANIGLGTAYFHRSELLRKFYDASNNKLNNIEQIKFADRIGSVFKMAANFENIHSGFYINLASKKLESNSLRDYLSIFVNYRIVNNDPFISTKKTKAQLSRIMLEGGIQSVANFGKYAGVFRIFFEPKILIHKNISVGLRTNPWINIAMGLDDEQYYVYEISEDVADFKWLTYNTLKETKSTSLTSQYYFGGENGWYFLSGGIGRFKRPTVTLKKEVFPVFEMPFPESLPVEQKNWGFQLGAGIKTGIYRLSLEYIHAGKNLPDAISLQMGLEPGLFRKKIKTNNGQNKTTQ